MVFAAWIDGHTAPRNTVGAHMNLPSHCLLSEYISEVFKSVAVGKLFSLKDSSRRISRCLADTDNVLYPARIFSVLEVTLLSVLDWSWPGSFPHCIYVFLRPPVQCSVSL